MISAPFAVPDAQRCSLIQYSEWAHSKGGHSEQMDEHLLCAALRTEQEKCRPTSWSSWRCALKETTQYHLIVNVDVQHMNGSWRGVAQAAIDEARSTQNWRMASSRLESHQRKSERGAVSPAHPTPERIRAYQATVRAELALHHHPYRVSATRTFPAARDVENAVELTEQALSIDASYPVSADKGCVGDRFARARRGLWCCWYVVLRAGCTGVMDIVGRSRTTPASVSAFGWCVE